MLQPNHLFVNYNRDDTRYGRQTKASDCYTDPAGIPSELFSNQLLLGIILFEAPTNSRCR